METLIHKDIDRIPKHNSTPLRDLFISKVSLWNPQKYYLKDSIVVFYNRRYIALQDNQNTLPYVGNFINLIIDGSNYQPNNNVWKIYLEEN